MHTNVQRQNRQTTDTTIALAVQLIRPDLTAVDITGQTVTFKMIKASDCSTKVAETSVGVTVTDAATGKVEYTFQDADVDTEGTFYAYFTATNVSDQRETFPAITKEMEVVIQDGC